MATVYVSTDSLNPANHAVEQAYYLGDGSAIPFGPPVLFDSGAGEQETLLPAGNTATVFTFGGFIYKLLNRQSPSFATVLVKSTDGGATFNVLDSANSPLFETCSGFFDAANSVVLCAYVDANGAGGNIHLIEFNLLTELWGSAFASMGPAAAQNASITVFRRTDATVIVLYQSRDTFNALDPSGLGAVVYDPVGPSWGTPFDAGAGITALTGWEPTQTIQQMSRVRVDMDPLTGVLHVFFATASLQTVPVVWGNRVFYQAINLDNSLGSFFDFPGQVAPFPAFPYNKQQLEAFTGPPMGKPLIVGNNIILPVSMRNDSVIDRFPLQVPNVYIGTPVSAPVWTLDSTGNIDPGVIADDFIWIQQAPSLAYDGTTIFAVYSAQDEDGQNLARLRMSQTTNLSSPAVGPWTGQTIFDLQVDAPPGFNFPSQFLSAAGAFASAAAPTPVGATCDHPPNGQVGVAYDHFFLGSGGTPPYTFTVTVGALPNGLSLNASTGEVTGIPTLAGNFFFTVTVTDSLGAFAGVRCSISIIGAVVTAAVQGIRYGSAGIPKYCADVRAGVDWGAITREFEALRPANVPEVRVPWCPPKRRKR